MAIPFAWGIDIGNRALKAVKLVQGDGGVRVDDFDLIEHEFILSNAGDNRDTLIQTALASFAGRHQVKGGAVAVGVSGQQSFARFIKLPPVEPKQVPNIVRFEAVQQIPFPLDEVEWSYQLFQNESSPEIEVGIFAMRKDLVTQHLKYFSDAGMNVGLVQMNPLAVYNALAHDNQLQGTTMIIDLGADNADLIIAEGEQIWMRSIPIGGNHFTEALVKQFKLRFEKAEEMKRNANGSKYQRQILGAMRPVFADLVSEIQRSIGFYSSVHRDSRIAQVLALGGTFNLPGLQKYLQQNLSLEVHKVGSLGTTPPADAKVATALNDNLLSAVGAYGLALQAMDLGKINSSLLPAHIRRERMWKAKTKWFAGAAAACVAASVLAGGNYFYQRGQFDTNKPLRDKAQGDIQKATGLVSSWKAIETGGGADKQIVTEVKSLAQYRDLWPDLYKTITAAVPAVPASSTRPTTGTANDTRLFVEEMQVEYRPDLGPVLSQPETQFITNAAKRDWGGRPVSRGGPATPLQGMRAADMMVPRPGAAAAPAEGGEAPKGPRGYLITLHLATPNPDAVGLVSRTVLSSLRRNGELIRPPDPSAKPADAAAAGAAAPAAVPGTYRIEKDKVAIASTVKFSQDDARKSALQERLKAIQELKAKANPVAAVVTQIQAAGGGGNRPGQAGGGMVPPPMMRVPGPGNFSGAPAEESANIYIDPVTGENVQNWSDVVVVFAVSADPTPKPAAPAAGG